MSIFLYLICTAALVWVVSAQSPTCQLQSGGDCVCGDPNVHSYCGTLSCPPEDRLDGNPTDYCRTFFQFRNAHIFPDEWELLFDSDDYRQNNVLGSVFLEGEFDSDASTLSARDRTWIQQGGECQRQFRACAWSQGQQDNWIFSKHIKNPPGSTTAGGGYSTDVYLNITYRFSSCNPHAGCTNNFVTLYKYDTNSIASSTEQTNKNNYVLLFGQGTENTDSRFQQIEDFDDDNVLRSFRPSGSTGFHLGIRDTGTCGYVDRILLYYTPCKKFQDGLVNYPELVRPPEGSPPNVAQACCAPNSRSTTSLSFRAYSDGRCEHGVMCECDSGYILDAAGTGCNACPAGTYRSMTDDHDLERCLPCPMNSMTDVTGAAAVCECVDGYFRKEPEEGPEFVCTSPPGPVRNLRSTTVTSTSVAVRWTRPEIIGRSDFYYTLQYSDPDNIGEFLPANPIKIVNSALSVSHTVTGLEPYTTYTIRVTSHNGVSDQDIENAALRIVTIQVRTLEGVPSAPQDVRAFSSVIVWGPPVEPNGVITGYQVRLIGTFSRTQTVTKGPHESYHVISDSDTRNFGSPIQVQVRARTSAGYGPYSSSITYTPGEEACPPTVTCSPCPPTIPPPICPTIELCPPCTDPTPCPFEPALKFTLRGRTYLDGNTVLITDIGEGDDAALLCVTDNTNCCASQAIGEFYYPDGSVVNVRGSEDSLYRNRGDGFIRLSRRNNALSPLGKYRCSIPDSNGVFQNIYIDIAVESPSPVTTPVTCEPCDPCNCPDCPSSSPPTDCPEVTLPPPSGNISLIHFSENLFLIMWGETRITKDGILRITEVGGPRKIRQESHVQLTIDIPIKPGQRVVTIPKDNLEDGRTYIMQAEVIVDSEMVGTTPAFDFNYKVSGEISTLCGSSTSVSYIALAIVLTFLLTAIIVTLLMIALSCLYITCRVKRGYYTISKKNPPSSGKY